MSLLDTLTFQAPKQEKKVHRNKHKMGICPCGKNERHVSKSGWVNTYCIECKNARQRDLYERKKKVVDIEEYSVNI